MCARAPNKDQGDNASHSDSLLDWIINSRRISERDVRPLAQQLARTLSLIHAHGVVHRNLKLENILVHLDPTTATARGEARRRATITDFTFAAVTVPAADPAALPAAALMARCGQQYNPAPELLPVRSMHTAQSGAQAEVPISDSYYAGPPVDVWGLGVVLYTLVCARVPFDGPTIDVIHEASLHSPASLQFPRRVSTDCRDLLQRMLQANPAARASLDEVLKHPWMNLSAIRCPRMSLLGAGSDAPKHAALKWPDQVDRKWFYRIAAIESKNGDDAWRSLIHTLELVSQLCEACSDGSSPAHTRSFTSRMSRLSRVRELLDRALSLLAKIRSRAVLEYSIQVSSISPLRKSRTKIVTT